MSFPWLECTPPGRNGSKARAEVAAAELADRAATLFRLGFSKHQATQRLCQAVAWEFHHKRPDALSDQAIGKIVAETFARRPGSW